MYINQKITTEYGRYNRNNADNDDNNYDDSQNTLDTHSTTAIYWSPTMETNNIDG